MAVLHFAAFIEAGESVREPERFYRNNVAGTLALLRAMREAGIDKLVFSSTAAVYGNPEVTPIPESHPLRPVNPYGRSKLMVEQILADAAAAHGLRYAALRYFNAAGADPDGELGENHQPETHLIPLVLQAAYGQRPDITVFGTDYRHAGRHLHPRLRARQRSGRGACAGAAPAARRRGEPRGEPRDRARLLRARGHRHGAGRDWSDHSRQDCRAATGGPCGAGCGFQLCSVTAGLEAKVSRTLWPSTACGCIGKVSPNSTEVCLPEVAG